jgi:uncharacterized protein (DUF58 family)
VRRPPPLVLVGLALLLCAGLVVLFGPTGESAEAPPVEIEVDPPRRAVLREPTRLEVRVTNRGAEPVRDLGVKINRGYANVMTVVETQPRAMIDDASTEKRLYFGRLEPGQTGVYRITMIPQRPGDFNLVVRVVAVPRGRDPIVLLDRATGRAEFTAVTEVLDPRPPTPTPPR